jgi:uncharacterized protein (UPF0548 family)
VRALDRWAMFDTGWTQLCWPETPIAEGEVVCCLARHLGFWSLNACRIVYVLDEPAGDGVGARHGFAYGTLSEHAEQGEERFSVERLAADETVWYDVLAFSRPGQLLARLGGPIPRALQGRFIRDSKRAMQRAVEEGEGADT